VKVTALFQKLKNFLFAEKDHSPRPLRPLVDVTGVEHRFNTTSSTAGSRIMVTHTAKAAVELRS